MSVRVLLQSAGLAAAAALVGAFFGLAGALWMAGANRYGRIAGRLAAVACLSLPPFLTVNAWLDLTAEWRAFQTPETAAALYLPLAAWVLAGMLGPLTLFLADGALRRVEPAWLEGDPLLRGWAAMRHVAWPAARGAAAAAASVSAALALANFTVPTLFQVRVFTEEFWLRFNTQLDFYGAAAAAWPLALPPLALALAARRRGATAPWRTAGGAPPELWRARLGPWRPAAGAVFWAWTALVAAAPLARLAFARRTWSELGPAIDAGGTAIAASLALAAFPALLALAAGVALAGPPGRSRGPGPLWALFFMPGILLGVACIQLFDRPPFLAFYRSLAMPGAALALRCLPVAWAAAAAAAARSDPRAEELLRTEGGGRWSAASLARWPQSAGLLSAAWLAMYLLCLWDVETVVLLQPPGGETLALRIFNLLHYGHSTQVNALAVAALALGAAGALAAAGLSRMRRPAPRWAALACAAAAVATGCSPAPEGGAAALDSKLFSTATVIGERGTGPGQFNKPRSLACDLDDNLYVSDMTGRIQKFSPDGRWLAQWRMPETAVGRPKGMGRDARGNILVVEPHYQRVNHFAPDGRLVAQWGVKGTNLGEYILPRAIAVDSHGEYYVTDYTLVDRVQRFAADLDRTVMTDAPVDGGPSRPVPRAPFRSVAAWGSPGAGPGQFNRAEGVAVDADDRVYVADSCNHRVQIFDPDGRFLRAVGRPGSGPGELSYPYDVRVDAEGRLLVCEFGNSRLSVFDRRGALLEVLGRAGAAPGEFANPWAIALDSKGDLYVADSQNHRVQKLVRRNPQPGKAPGSGALHGG